MRSDVNEMIQMRRSSFISAARDAADHSNSHVHKFIQSLILSLAGSWRTWASSNWPERVCSVLGVNMGLISHPWTERYRCSHQNNWQWIACFTHNVRKLVTFGHISRCTQFFSGSLFWGYIYLPLQNASFTVSQRAFYSCEWKCITEALLWAQPSHFDMNSISDYADYAPGPQWLMQWMSLTLFVIRNLFGLQCEMFFRHRCDMPLTMSKLVHSVFRCIQSKIDVL